MKKLYFMLFVLCLQEVLAQQEQALNLGYQLITIAYEEENCQVLIKSKPGDEDVKKPLLVYFQGSLARPLLIQYPQHNNYVYDMAFPFSTEKILDAYHIAVIAKPFIPVLVPEKDLDASYSYVEEDGKNPEAYLKHNNLEYMVARNQFVVDFLNKLPRIEKNEIILIGVSEGSRIAFEVAQNSKTIKAVALLSANPFGRYLNTVAQQRTEEATADFLKEDEAFAYWKTIAQHKDENNYSDGGDTYKSWFAYSQPYNDALLKLKKPVFFGYGTKDPAVPYYDLFAFQVLQAKQSNIHVTTYQGLDHSFYRVDENGVVDHEVSFFDHVVKDIINWLD